MAVVVESVTVVAESVGVVAESMATIVESVTAVVEADSDAILAAGSEKMPVEEVVVDDAESDVPAAAEVEDAVGAVVLTSKDDPLAMVLEATDRSAPSSSSSSESSPESLPKLLSSSSPEAPELSSVSSPEPLAPEGGAIALMGPVPAAGATTGAAGVKTKVTFRAWEAGSESKAFADDACDGGVVASVQSSSRFFTKSCARFVPAGAALDIESVAVEAESEELVAEELLEDAVEEGPLPADVVAVELSGPDTLPSGSSEGSELFEDHIGRMTPVAGSKAKSWLLCSPPAVLLAMHSSTVNGDGAGGFGSNVAQYGSICAVSSLKTGICNATWMNERSVELPADVELSADVELLGDVELAAPGVATRYI